MSLTDWEQRILEYVGRPSYQPVALKPLAKKLGVSRPEYAEFRGAVKALLRQGRLQEGRNRSIRVTPPHGTMGGIFRSTKQGFGFVRPHLSPGGPQKDVYIRRDHVRDAASGDEVLVQITKRPYRPGQRPEGRIIQIIERATHQFVGTYREEGGAGYVQVDGAVFAQPIYVGDPGAKGAKPGDKVVFEMVRFPAPGQEGEGVLTEVLGPRGQPGVDTLSIIREFNLPDGFADDALEESRGQAAAFDEDNLEGRQDFTHETIVTIDPADARDFDDAISLKQDRKGHWQLGVHIADVSHFVRTGSALFRTARQRGTSVYLPDRVLPMLPELISNSLASLQQGKVRYTKSALLEYDREGMLLDVEIVRSAIKVTKRLDYETVTRIYESPAAFQGKLSAKVRALLERMRELALVLRRRRHDQGSLELSMPEVKIDLDDDGRVIGAHYVPHDISHQIIEEFMLAANVAVARHLKDRGVLFLRRIHQDPDPQKLRAFGEFAQSLGFRIKQPQSRFELQKVLAQAANRPEVYAVNYALLRSLKQAIYSPADEGHYALASDCYTHFTSPIRRLPDLTVHALLDELWAGKRPRAHEGELVALSEHCTFTERRAEQAERELIKVKLLEFMSERLGTELTAVITGVEEFGFFAQAEELPVDGLVHVSTLADDYYYYEGATHSLVGRRRGHRYRLGDVVRLRVAHVDQERRQLDFRVAGRR
ncbi:MAG: ribonuclease R [Planctomycetes bacterium]|nr:ribonuclease R [Planctomycetota bacterium]